jgi:protein-disulfide isomerase
MQKTINRILLSIIAILVILLLYKTLRSSNTVSGPTAVTTIEQKTFEEPIRIAAVQSDEELKDRIQPLIKDYLMNNPEIIISAIEQMQKRKMQEMEDQTKSYITEKKAEIENTSSSPVLGNLEGDITIIAFYDYNCGYCKKGNNYLNELIQTDKGVKIVLKQLPVLGETSNHAARIALAVHKISPEKFRLVHEGLMGIKGLTKENIDSVLTANGLNVQAIEKESENTEIKELINKNFEIASNLRIQGAPAYIINGKLVPGLIDLSQLQQIIQELRKDAALNTGK